MQSEISTIKPKSEAIELIEILDATIAALERRDIGIGVGHEEMIINARLAHLHQLCDDWLKQSED